MDKVISDHQYLDPDFKMEFGVSMEDLQIWGEDTEQAIEDLLLDREQQISIRKGFSQSGFQKRKLPSFDGSILENFNWKKKWANKVPRAENQS